MEKRVLRILAQAVKKNNDLCRFSEHYTVSLKIDDFPKKVLMQQYLVNPSKNWAENFSTHIPQWVMFTVRVSLNNFELLGFYKLLNIGKRLVFFNFDTS